MKKVLDKDELRDPNPDWSRAKGHIWYNPTQEEKLILQQAKDFSELTPRLQKYVEEAIDHYNETGKWFGQ